MGPSHEVPDGAQVRVDDGASAVEGSSRPTMVQMAAPKAVDFAF
jgi:hypothetical protein